MHALQDKKKYGRPGTLSGFAVHKMYPLWCNDFQGLNWSGDIQKLPKFSWKMYTFTHTHALYYNHSVIFILFCCHIQTLIEATENKTVIFIEKIFKFQLKAAAGYNICVT